MKTLRIVAVTCLALFGAAGAFASGDWDYDSDRITGSGFVKTQNRSVSAFTGIEVEGSGTVILSQGIVRSVSVETDDNVQRVVKTEVIGGVLHLGFQNGVRISGLTKLEFRITAPLVDQITISGSGDVRALGTLQAQSLALAIHGSGSIDAAVDAEILRADIGGSGDIEVGGQARELIVDIGGSGSVRARGLQSVSADVRINGSGNADVTARDTIAISINGSGNVLYGGGARATVRSSGSGTAQER